MSNLSIFIGAKLSSENNVFLLTIEPTRPVEPAKQKKFGIVYHRNVTKAACGSMVDRHFVPLILPNGRVGFVGANGTRAFLNTSPPLGLDILLICN